MTLDPTPWRDAVPPLPPDAARPRWSVMVPTYRCAGYIAQALRSVLDQDPGPGSMQIEVVDDGSDDDVEAVVRDIGGGRVGFYAQPRNVGHIANFQTCLERARGDIVHLLHGDDFVRPGFYAALQRGFDADPLVGAAYCRSIYVDADGRETGLVPAESQTAGVLPHALQRLATEQRVMTPSIAVRRSVYEQLGGFDRRLICAEDWEMWVRIAARHRIWYDPEPRACYRMHSDSNTGRHVGNAADAAFNLAAIRMLEAYLPADEASALIGRARRTYAGSALHSARQLLEAGDIGGFQAQARAAWRLWPSTSTAIGVLRAACRGWGSYARSR
jgi:glycosyltransferase involved in cell wall biosynthesis